MLLLLVSLCNSGRLLIGECMLKFCLIFHRCNFCSMNIFECNSCSSVCMLLFLRA